jgi:hypothetical protein
MNKSAFIQMMQTAAASRGRTLEQELDAVLRERVELDPVLEESIIKLCSRYSRTRQNVVESIVIHEISAELARIEELGVTDVEWAVMAEDGTQLRRKALFRYLYDRHRKALRGELKDASHWMV